MANILNKRTIVLDVEGVISTSPICIRSAIIYPNAAADAATFYSWDITNDTVSTKVDKTTTVATANTLTSTGNFPTATVNPEDIIVISWTDTGNNKVTRLIDTNADDNTIVVNDAGLTNETNRIYSWKIVRPWLAFKTGSPGTEKIPWTVDFGDKGRWFPNLAMGTLSTSATVALFVK